MYFTAQREEGEGHLVSKTIIKDHLQEIHTTVGPLPVEGMMNTADGVNMADLTNVHHPHDMNMMIEDHLFITPFRTGTGAEVRQG